MIQDAATAEVAVQQSNADDNINAVDEFLSNINYDLDVGKMPYNPAMDVFFYKAFEKLYALEVENVGPSETLEKMFYDIWIRAGENETDALELVERDIDLIKEEAPLTPVENIGKLPARMEFNEFMYKAFEKLYEWDDLKESIGPVKAGVGPTETLILLAWISGGRTIDGGLEKIDEKIPTWPVDRRVEMKDMLDFFQMDVQREAAHSVATTIVHALNSLQKPEEK